MRINKPTFSKILEQAERDNCERLMAKARLANKLAKISGGVNRRTAYQIKSKALYSLVRRLNKYVRISDDNKLPDFVVIGLKNERSGLHLPFAGLID